MTRILLLAQLLTSPLDPLFARSLVSCPVFIFLSFCFPQQWMTNQGSIEQLFKGNFLPHL